MKKCIIVSDSFKGTLSSREICDIAEETLPRFFPECRLIPIPVADGGEGTVDCLIAALGAQAVNADAAGAYMEPRKAIYAKIGCQAVIEMAAAAGLPSVGKRRDPSLTTTYGVGQLIEHAILQGCRHIYLGLGGSATNDGGCGCAAALGAVFRDASGQSFVPVGATLSNICSIDISHIQERLKGIDVTIMSDVKNPLCGENGAAAVFGPQKGADERMVDMLDAGLAHMAELISSQLGVDVSEIPGAGAAGGMGAGAMAFLGGKMCSGIEAVLTLTDFDSQLKDADLVITGEGRLDAQSMNGKVISGVAAHCKALGKPLVAIVGCTGEGADAAYELGISSVSVTNRSALPFEKLKQQSADDYRRALSDLLRLIRLGAAIG